MKTVKYLISFIISLAMFNSCLVDDETKYDLNDDGLNVVTFETITSNITALANGDEYTFKLKVKLVGPTKDLVKNSITVSAAPNELSTAVQGEDYRIENLPITLSPENNFLGTIDLVLVTEGNTPPMDGTPEFDEYVAPVLLLDLTATGDDNVIGSGKSGTLTLNFTPPNPYAGLYDVELLYFHPTAGGTYPTDPYGGVRAMQKELIPITGRKCETGFAVWPETDLCWITINADNSIKFEVAATWPYSVTLGDPYDASKISHYDPATGKIYLYYSYQGSGGPRIFWETFTPAAKK